MKAKPRTIDEYLAGAGVGQRAALEKLRKTIRAVAPKAEECISYGLAAFRLNGRPLVAFGAWANHCAFYPMSSTTVKAFQDQLKNFETSKGYNSLHRGQTVADGAGEEDGQSANRGERRLMCGIKST